MDRTYVSFAVFDFEDDVRAVTDQMGTAPTKAWCVGDPLPGRPTARRTHSRWVLESGLDETAGVEEHFLTLVAVLEARSERVRATTERFAAELQCAIYYEDETPGIRLPAELIRRIASLGVGIDFDLYFTGLQGDER